MKQFEEISVREAAVISGLSIHWLRKLITKEKSFSASKPFGNCKGWKICLPSFENWLRERRYRTTNTMVGRIKK